MNDRYKTATTIIVTAIIGVAVATITGFFCYKAGIAQVKVPIISTQSAVAKQMPTVSAENNLVSIQDMSFWAELYTYGPDFVKASSHLVIYNSESGYYYQVIYSMPQTGNVYTGLYFSFVNSVNLAEFNFIEVTIGFGDENTSLDISIKDISLPQNVPTIRIGKNIDYPDYVEETQIGDDRKIKIPLSIFDPFDAKSVKQIGFRVGVFSPGNHSFTIKSIDFLKK